MRIQTLILIALMAGGSAFAARAAQGEVLYQNDFQKSEPGSVPDEFLVLDGSFAVREENGHRYLELPGAPLETFGVLFGPNERENVIVTARILGTHRGRRFPTFAVGLNGVAGYKLQISPAKKQIELLRGDNVRASVDHDWTSGEWTRLKLEVRKVGDKLWNVRGKVWPDGTTEPADWTVNIEEQTEPISGRASVWGSPFAGTPIRFDDFLVTRPPAAGQ